MAKKQDVELEYLPDRLGRLGRGEWRNREQRDPFGRLAPDEPLDFTDPFELTDAVGRGRANRRNDVAKIEALLALADGERALLRSGPTGSFDDAVDEAIRRHQRGRGLAVDGWVAPDGETAQSLRREVTRLAAARLVRNPPPDPKAAERFHREIDREEENLFWRTPDPLWMQFLRALTTAIFGSPKPLENVPTYHAPRG